MGFFDNIKNKITDMVNRVRTKRLPEGQFDYMQNNGEQGHNPYNRQSNTHMITRQDGSILQIEPILDATGNQTYEQVFNRRTGQFQCIPKFTIMADELKQLVHPQVLAYTISMDINPQLLDNPQYADFIANSMLSAERMRKVVNEYENYAGGIGYTKEGKLGKFIDEGIVSTLKDTRENNYRIVQEQNKQREEQELQRKLEEIRKRGVHIKKDHAEDLSNKEFGRY